MYFVFLFTLTTILFKNAFSTYFFNDDFFFLKISRINNIQQFFNLFSPIRQVSYKPVSQEFFYFLVHLVKENIFLAHTLIFLVFFIGIYYLVKIILLLTKNKLFSYLTAGLYAINFTHVFQLYYLATFQDVAIFTFICLSFYFFLKERNSLSLVFFVIALLSKETAVLFIPFLILFSFICSHLERSERSSDRRSRNASLDFSVASLLRNDTINKILPYLVLGIFFTILYQYSLKYVTSLENYKIAFNPRLIVNNAVWYLLWSLGAPNFTSLYFTSIFKPPIADFWKMLTNFPEIRIYYLLLISYYLLMIIGISYYLLKNKKELFKLVYWLLIGLVGFFTFLGPILFFEHRWMVRLAVPLIFIVLIQSTLILKLIKAGKTFRFLAFVLIGLYVILQILGTSIHESSSTFLLESRFTQNAKKYFEKNKKEITKYKHLYFVDKTKIVPMPWGGSEKLKVTLSDQNFIDHYFPKTAIKVVYGFENKKIPPNSYIVNSFDILLPE